ncbi:MAG: M15 family metallopeptidase [Acidimicrobiales bacterium]
MPRSRLVVAAIALITAAATCTSTHPESVAPPPVTAIIGDATSPTTADGAGDQATTSSTEATTSSPSLTRPDWLGQRVLTTDETGFAPAQDTPPELVDRQLPTIDTLPAPIDGRFHATVEALAGEPLERSTWEEGCPVEPADLRYLTMSFWGFDGAVHTGEMIVHADAARGIVDVFEALFEARFPIEEMRVVTPADLDAPPTGDGNNTSAFVCRAVTGGTSFSQHAYGLAVDVNPFLNPYLRGDLVLPELSTAYLDRERGLPGMIEPGSVAVEAFAAMGWSWGGDWESLKDWQHFSHNGR